MNPTAHDVTAEDGTRLRVWEDATDETIDAEEAVLFLHGGMTHSRALFAPPVEGDDSYSWLRAATAAGRAAYALDVRGYGESEFPPEMDEPPEENDPPVLAEDAAVDVAAAFAFVADRHETVHVVGVSWGTMTGGVFFAENDPDAASFTMCAPVYDPTYEFEAGVAALGLDTDLNAYFVDDRETVEARQDGEENPVFEAVWTAMVESGQGLGDRDGMSPRPGPSQMSVGAVTARRPTMPPTSTYRHLLSEGVRTAPHSGQMRWPCMMNSVLRTTTRNTLKWRAATTL